MHRPWSRRFDLCIDCGRKDRPHVARGRCTACDTKWRYAENPEPRRADAKRRRLSDAGDRDALKIAAWRKAHPEKIREYQRNRRMRLRMARTSAPLGGVARDMAGSKEEG